MGQFLTAVFELRPTLRKAAALERVRATNEEAFWEFMDAARAQADAALSLPKKEQRNAVRDTCKGALHVGVKHRLVEAVAHGLHRDVDQSVSSYVELKSAGQDASWPVRNAGQEAAYLDALAALAAASDIESETAARNALAKVRKAETVRPLVFARSRDARILRNGKGRYAVALNCLWASDLRSRKTYIREGVDPTTGEPIKAGQQKTKLVIPFSCSRWHENKFLNGSATLRSSLVFRRGKRWFIASQFEFPEKKAALSGAVMGIDRGVIYPVSASVVDKNGALIDLMEPQGKAIGETIQASDERRRNQQRRRGITDFRHQEVLRHALHRIANDIVRSAIEHGAEVVVEKLGEMKKVITTERPKFSRKGGWRRVLKRAQLGELEKILEYKLALAGLPKIKEVMAAGTSQTCPACGHKAKENRPERDVFKCVQCGHTAHADQNASIVIARRGVIMRTLKKGDKLDVLHQNMVSSLRTRHDGGLGRRELFAPVVPAHVSATVANADSASSPTSVAEQKVTRVDQNADCRVFAERIDANFSGKRTGDGEPDQ